MVIFCAKHGAGAQASARAKQTARKPRDLFSLRGVIFIPPRSK
jgi:hypothetical protein